MERRIMRDFPEPGSAREIIAVLDRMAAEADYQGYPASERVMAAIILLANGNVTRFFSEVNIAMTDWRDLLMGSVLANEDRAARLDAELGPADDTR